MLRPLIRTTLESSGYTVVEAQAGEEALQNARQHTGPIHLMLTDVVMPKMSGRQLADRLAPLQPSMRVLYMSGYADEAIVHHGVLEPGTCFIEKPFTPASLLRKVRETLEAGHEVPARR